MLRPLLAATLLASTAFAVANVVGSAEFYGTASRASGATSIDDIEVCKPVWQHEPLVVFDVSGTTLVGNVRMNLSVYDDGDVKTYTLSKKTIEWE